MFGYIARHYLELDSKVSFCSRLKALVDNLLRLNTEKGCLVIVETELETFCHLLEQRCPTLTDRQNDKPTECYNPLCVR